MAKGRKKGGAAGSWTQGLWLKPLELCHWAMTPTDNHPSFFPFYYSALEWLLMWLCVDCCMQLLIMKGWCVESEHGESNRWTPPQSEDRWKLSNQRQSEPLLSEDLWNGKKKEEWCCRESNRGSGLSWQCSATKPQHPPTTTIISSPFITLLFSDYWWNYV